MTDFVWRIDSQYFIHSRSSDNMSIRQFIGSVCHQLDVYSQTYTLEQLKSGAVAHCHVHDKKRENKDTTEYKSLFGQLKKINIALAEQYCQIEPDDVLQVAFPNISDRFRGFGYILNNVFYLIYLDPYHKVYK